MAINIIFAAAAALFAVLSAVLAVKLHFMRRSRDRLILSANHARDVARRKSEEAASSMRTAQYSRAQAQQVWAHSKALYDRYREITEKEQAAGKAEDGEAVAQDGD